MPTYQGRVRDAGGPSIDGLCGAYYSAGVLHLLGCHFPYEAWLSQPSLASLAKDSELAVHLRPEKRQVQRIFIQKNGFRDCPHLQIDVR